MELRTNGITEWTQQRKVFVWRLPFVTSCFRQQFCISYWAPPRREGLVSSVQVLVLQHIFSRTFYKFVYVQEQGCSWAHFQYHFLYVHYRSSNMYGRRGHVLFLATQSLDSKYKQKMSPNTIHITTYRDHWMHRRGRKNFCLQKSRMPLTGLVYFFWFLKTCSLQVTTFKCFEL